MMRKRKPKPWPLTVCGANIVLDGATSLGGRAYLRDCKIDMGSASILPRGTELLGCYVYYRGTDKEFAKSFRGVRVNMCVCMTDDGRKGMAELSAIVNQNMTKASAGKRATP